MYAAYVLGIRRTMASGKAEKSFVEVCVVNEEKEDVISIDFENTVWVCVANRIASFHPVPGYERQSFLTHDYFMSYLKSLQDRGFRFQ